MTLEALDPDALEDAKVAAGRSGDHSQNRISDDDAGQIDALSDLHRCQQSYLANVLFNSLFKDRIVLNDDVVLTTVSATQRIAACQKQSILPTALRART